MKTVAFILVILVSTIGSSMALAADDVLHVWHSKTLSFAGPASSEADEVNPFADVRLLVTFTNGEHRYVVRGFYAADGRAAESGARSGNVWQVRFTPDHPGQWHYSASLHIGIGVAINDDPNAGEPFPLENRAGVFEVLPVMSDHGADNRDFRGRGRLVSDGHYLRFGHDGVRLLKGGANSPENLLAMTDFDGTYRQPVEVRDGETAPSMELHEYATHLADWQEGDPQWQGGKGKALIGAINYLASMGMNAIYFLTMNIGGDGKDVWPYASPDDFTRFDCSRLDQWEIVFNHMQRKGIMMHVVTQETENELLLDDGNTEFLRKLYYRELIARFAHHPALIWNLGEENGPAEFSPEGQSPAQQKAMADYIKKHDPYDHPVVIHTHSIKRFKDDTLPALLGHPTLDGLSFQIDPREEVNEEMIRWRELSIEAKRPWMITMDEIGKWDTGAKTDSEDPGHDSLRYHALWGSLLGGGAGVEWYFGAFHPHNDLGSEDWRQRENLWQQTRVALEFFETRLPYWNMKPANSLLSVPGAYTFAQPGTIYTAYLPAGAAPADLDLEENEGTYEVLWFDPVSGGYLQKSSTLQVTGPGVQSLGSPPQNQDQDWVVLVRLPDL